MKRMFLWLTVAIFATLVVGCSGGSTGGGNTITGVVKDFNTGANLSGVTVKTGSVSVSSDSSGAFTLSGVTAADRIVVTFTKDGYTTTAKITKLTADITKADLQVSMLPVAYTGTLDPSTPQTLKQAGQPWQVVLGADALDASGNVKWEVTPIDPARMGIEVMPGDMTNTDDKPIESYGALTVTFKNGNGEKVNLRSGQTATIRIPASMRSGATPPATIPLYSFDEETGYWKAEGNATLAGTAPNQYYEGTVSHFSTWNADQEYNTIAIHGCVVDEDGDSIADARITMEGDSYNGIDESHSNADGNFTIYAMKGADSLVFAQKDIKVSSTTKIQASQASADYTMPECLVLGDAPFTVRLTWGTDPSDLDTHVVGPDGPSDYHIWYQNEGSLASDPNDRSNLDVDDTTSYGPEVYTALKLPKAGTYHYAVYKYAGTSNIAASPARVEVMLDGVKTVFVPTGTHTEDWWKVFDFTVNDAGKVTGITQIDTWTNDTGWPGR